MIKYFNYVFFAILIVVFILLDVNSKISTNLYSMLPSSENKELLSEFLKFESNKKIFLTIKGDNKESLEKLNEIEEAFLKIDGVKKEELKINTKLFNYQKKYQLYINELDTKKLDNLDMKLELTKLYNSMFNVFFTVDINKQDPFNLIIREQRKINIKYGKLLLGEHGYLTIFTVSNDKDSLKEYEKIYDKIKIIEDKNTEITSFSSIYYFVENSRYIKNDATNIVMFATCILLLLYLVVLRNMKLLINTLLTLSSSTLVATILLTLVYEEMSLFVLVFGLSISTIAIDYMFHHYFHKAYEQKVGFNKEVFLGFLTTFGAFFILSFVDFLLIKQITQFAMVSLLYSYVIFAFIYPSITFKEKKFVLRQNKLFSINTTYIFLGSILVLLYSLQNLNYDFNVQSLNYDNQSLKQKELFFKDKLLNKKQQVVMIKAKTVDELISFNEKIKSISSDSSSSLDTLISKNKFIKKKVEFATFGFDNIKSKLNKYSHEIGFKKDSFNEAYSYKKEIPVYTYEDLLEFGIAIRKYKNNYVSPIYVSSENFNEVLKLDFVYPINLQVLFENSLQSDMNKMLKLGLFSLLFIVIIVMLITKNNRIYALTFLALPSAIILLYLSFQEINILHIFMLFIILALSVDYAIYSSQKNSISAKKAIMFSALSSFAGFGVLVFSSTPSLYSIGSVATLGVVAILFLILCEKARNVS